MAKMGRPKIPKKDRHSANLRIRFTPSQVAELRRRASLFNLTVAEMIRATIFGGS